MTNYCEKQDFAEIDFITHYLALATFEMCGVPTSTTDGPTELKCLVYSITCMIH